jgi:hypothetical protein
MSSLQVSQLVPLLATLECPDGETVFVRATIKDKDNAVLAQLALINNGGGEFSLSTYLMPDEPFIKVRYEVFDDAGFNTPNTSFCPDDESYSRLEIAQAQAVKTDHLVGFVRGVRLFGKINYEQKKLIGIVSEVKLAGIIKPLPRLLGIVSNESLTGSLKG